MRYELDGSGSSPVTLAGAKDFLKTVTDADDTVIAKLIADITSFAERFTGRQLRKNSWIAFRDDLPAEICLMKTPVERITSIQYIDEDGSAQTVDPAVYELKVGTIWATILTSDDQSWPTDIGNISDAVMIQFDTKAHRLTSEVESCMLRHIAYLYENRGDDETTAMMRQADFYRRVSIPLV